MERNIPTSGKTLDEFYQKLYNIGVMSINEIRKEIDLTEMKDGDTHFVAANLLSVKEAANNRPSNSMLQSSDSTEKEKTDPPQRQVRSKKK